MERIKRLWGVVRSPKYWRFMFAGVVLITAFLVYHKVSQVDGATPDNIEKYLSEGNSLQVGSDIVNEFQQVYLDFGRVRSYLTNDSANHTSVVTSGQYVAWVATAYGDNNSLVYLYDSLSRSTKQITSYGSASKLAIDGNRLVWESSTPDMTAVQYYDGSQVMTISGENVALRPKIRASQVIFAEYLGNDTYQTILYDTEAGKTEVIAKGSANEAGWPQFIGDKITTNGPYN